MEATALKSIVSVLANSCYVRYWLHYNWPANPPLMAISVMGSGEFSQIDKELKQKGCARDDSDREFHVWTIERSDLDWMEGG